MQQAHLHSSFNIGQKELPKSFSFPISVLPIQQSSNPYSNADDEQQELAAPSEQQNQEMSSRRTRANTSKQTLAYALCGIIQMASHFTSSVQPA